MTGNASSCTSHVGKIVFEDSVTLIFYIYIAWSKSAISSSSSASQLNRSLFCKHRNRITQPRERILIQITKDSKNFGRKLRCQQWICWWLLSRRYPMARADYDGRNVSCFMYNFDHCNFEQPNSRKIMWQITIRSIWHCFCYIQVWKFR